MSPAKTARAPAKPKAAKKAVGKATPKAAPKKSAVPRFGRSGTAGKAEGDAAVKAWMAGIKPGHRAIVRRFDALAAQMLPGVKRAVKWSAPFYGLPGKGWVATVASFKGYVSIGFFAGAHLKPAPPMGESGSMRRVTLRSEADYDEAQLRAWLKQASGMQGWGKVEA